MRIGLGGEARWELFGAKPQTAVLKILIILIAVFCTFSAGAQARPNVVSQTNWLATLPLNGRVFTGANAAGSNFAVNSSGEVAVGDTYGSEVLLLNGQTGAVEKQWHYTNPGAVAVDAQDNLYIASLYSGYIIKLPYVNGTYADLTTDPQTMVPASCNGSDTKECAWGGNLLTSVNNVAFGIGAMTFDARGDFFFATDGYPSGTATIPFSIFECAAASSCISTANTGSGSGVSTVLFSEPASMPSTYCTSSDATLQVMPGSLAVDPWGNLFFTDSAQDTCGSTDGTFDQSDYSDLNELAANSDGSYAAVPVKLYTLTPNPPFAYNDQIDAVTVDANGTVYFGSQYGGILAFANNGVPFTGPVQAADMYGVWTYNAWSGGARAIAHDAKGNLYVVSALPPVSGGAGIDTVGLISLNSIPFPASPVGTATSFQVPAAVTSAVKAIDTTMVMANDADCSTASLSLAVTENGQPSSEFAGTPGTCTDSTFLPGQSSFDATLTFTPANVGARSAVLTATETSTGKSVAATAFGVGQGGLVALDPGNPPVAYVGFSNPAGISVDAAGDLFVADVGANKVDKIAAGSKTLTSIGTGFSAPSGIALDASGNLYVADTGNNRIVEIAGATGTPGAQTTAISSSIDFAGTPLSGPTGLAMGADGVLYISDTGNNRAVTYNPANGITGVRASGLSNPGGIAVDASGTLYVANAGTSGEGNVSVYPGGGGAVTTIAPNDVTTPIGIAVEPSGSLLVSDGSTGAIVRVPSEGGTLIDKNPQSGGGLALDAAGNLYTTDVTGKTAYAIQRTASTVNIGPVDDGASKNSFDLFAENIGNMPLALVSGATSFLTQPSTSNFAITSGYPNDCLAATSLGPGAACEFIANFSPVLGTASGDLTDSADFNSTAVNPTAVITLNGTAEYEAAATPNFSIALGAASLSVKAGGNESTSVSVTPQNGFNAPVTFSCSGLPAGAACSFSPATVTPSGGVAATTQLTVTVPSTSAALHRDPSPFLPGGAALACVLCGLFGIRKRRNLLAGLLLVASLAGLGLVSGCGMHLNSTRRTTTSTITVKATSGSLNSTATFTLTVQ